MTAHSTDGPREFSTLVELLRTRALKTPERRAYTFLASGEEETASLTYAELDRRARAVAAALQAAGAPGERALLLYQPGLEFIAAFFGCLYAGVIPVPCNPPKLNRKASRLEAIVEDCHAALALTTSGLLPKVTPGLPGATEFGGVRWMATDELETGPADGWREPDVTGDTLAFIQYTSGSTSVPKGVMVNHANVLYNLAYLDHNWGNDADCVCLTWLPHFHDMGLIDGILQPLFKGFHSYLMPPAAFLQRPARWLQAISRYRVTHSGAPNFAFDLCTRKTTEEQRAALDLSSWGSAYNGAEPVRRETLEKFKETFAPCGFRPEALNPSYGLAEATLIVTGGLRTSPPVYCAVEAGALEQNLVREAAVADSSARTFVGVGRASMGTRVAIVRPASSTLCAPDEVGEIWVSGPGVGAGYWGRAEETARTFGATLADTGEGPFLRTGDLGFVRGGELFITGRLKDLIIIDGQNHYPQDIELTVEQSHPAVRAGCCACFAVELEGQERLVVMAELERTQRHSDEEEVRKAIRLSVAEHHDLRVHAVVLLKTGTIIKTSSGKIQRRACGASFLAGLAGAESR